MSESLVLGQVAATPAMPMEPSALELEDLLYDILASGADPSLAAGTLEAVQTFLHEHARNKRSQAEFKAFFVQHKLSMLKDSGISFALPPMDMRAPARAQQHKLPPIALPDPEPIEVQPVAIAEAAQQSRTAIWAAAALVLAALSGGAFWAAASTRSELEQVRAEQRASAATLERVQAEATNLRESLDRNADLARSVDHKTELLLQSLVSPLDPARR